jgi:hypothetical protein
MKKYLALSLITLLAPAILAADAKDEVVKAAKKLAEKPNYSWRTTVTVPESARFKPGPIEGKSEKGGVTHLLMSFGDNSADAFLKGDKGALKNEEGEWRSLDEIENSEGRGRFMAIMLKNFKNPAEQAEELANHSKLLKKDGDVVSGELTEEGAKTLLTFRRGNNGPEVNNAKGNVKFWIKDGELSKYEYSVTGTIKINENDIDVDRTTNVQIKDVGTTKVTVPESAQKKLS